MITLSCGHVVDSFNGAFDVMVKANNREGGKAISYMVVCGSCKDGYRQDGHLFDNQEQAYDWLESGLEYNWDHYSGLPAPNAYRDD